jgi:nucleotide-binding universal stress UspA family protein
VIQSILVAVDTSPRAPGVLAVAREMGTRFEARVHLYRVVHIPPDIPAAGHSSDDRGQALLRERAAADLADLARDAPELIVERPELSDVPPWRAILAAADRLDVDLIIVGSHGFSGLDYILGTNAARVVNFGSRNVLVVHDKKGPARPPALGGGPPWQ